MERRLQPAVWLGLAALTLALYIGPIAFAPLVVSPDAWVLSPSAPLNALMDGFVFVFGAVFKLLGWLLEWPIIWARTILQALPWSVTAAAFVIISYIGSGWRLAVFAALAIVLISVLISVPMAVAIGFAVGVLGFYSDRAKQIIMPTLDLLQTIPAFAYLLPILILFGFGATVGLVASVLYAFAPMVRNTILGLRAVPGTITEAGLMAGATPSQLFWKVRLPAAKNQMLLGVNQTTMASLSMVIIASIIGGANDIG